MALQLIWSPAARLDLRDILSYVKESNPIAAVELGRRVFDIVERLPEFPESGRIVPEFLDPVIREVIHHPFRIVYQIRRDKGAVEIIRVWHAARGIPGL